MNINKLKKIEELINNCEVEKIPNGWYSRQQIAKALNRSQCRADEIICKMLKRKLIKRKEFKIRTKAGVRLSPFFNF
jgi:hypothetical protein